jgi:hypothetical protein
MAERLLTVYSRAQCHLCGEMIEALRSLQGLGRFDIEVVDVDSDPALARLHGEKVPVLVHGERELCHYRLERGALVEYLASLP